MFYLSRNHPFIDGNKRTALAACLVFLHANERLSRLNLPIDTIDDWEALAWDIAASRIDREEATKRLRKLLRASSPASVSGRRRSPRR